MKILFLGNSYTYCNDMPKLFSDLAKENDKDVLVESVTRGGKFLHQNLEPNDVQYGEVCDVINKYDYDVLFLQEQSFFALIDYETFENSVCNLTQKINAKRTILYCTWGRKTGSKTLEEHGWTSESMSINLLAQYTKASKKAKAEISLVGPCFYAILKTFPELELYTPDLSHPSYLGSCVVAISHYFKIFNELPKSFDCLNLDKNTLSKICLCVEKAYSKLD